MDGQVAILTGGAGKLGRGISRALTKAGATVVALDLDVSPADSVARAIVCDVTDPRACASAVQQTVDEFGGVNTLVNLAQRYFCDNPIMELTDDDLRASLESGPIATMRMMQLCYPHMKAAGGGAIINFVSGAGTQGTPRMTAYAAAKEAIRGITKSAAMEWGRDNIRVNAIAPFGGDNPEMHPEYVAMNPMGRYGDPETDIGSVVVFFAGAGVYVTGRTLHVDGGIGTFR